MEDTEAGIDPIVIKGMTPAAIGYVGCVALAWSTTYGNVLGDIIGAFLILVCFVSLHVLQYFQDRRTSWPLSSASILGNAYLPDMTVWSRIYN